MKWLKSLFRIVACLLVLLVLGAGVGWYLLRGRPSWYDVKAIDGAALQAAAERAENQLKRTIDWASSQQAEERAAIHAARGGPASPATGPSTRRALSVTFTEDELNATFQKWGKSYGWDQTYGQYVSDPRVILHDGRLIVAGEVKQVGSLVSLHFEPGVDERGRLRFDLVRVLGGRLPLPESVFEGYRDRLEQKVRASLPDLQRGADIKPDGSANEKAVAATFAKLLLSVLDRRPGEPVLFLPANQGARVPVKLADVKIDGKSIALTVQLMTQRERADLLRRIREPEAKPIGVTASAGAAAPAGAAGS